MCMYIIYVANSKTLRRFTYYIPSSALFFFYYKWQHKVLNCVCELLIQVAILCVIEHSPCENQLFPHFQLQHIVVVFPFRDFHVCTQGKLCPYPDIQCIVGWPLPFFLIIRLFFMFYKFGNKIEIMAQNRSSSNVCKPMHMCLPLQMMVENYLKSQGELVVLQRQTYPQFQQQVRCLAYSAVVLCYCQCYPIFIQPTYQHYNGNTNSAVMH